jgi:hypothetical protein
MGGGILEDNKGTAVLVLSAGGAGPDGFGREPSRTVPGHFLCCGFEIVSGSDPAYPRECCTLENGARIGYLPTVQTLNVYITKSFHAAVISRRPVTTRHSPLPTIYHGFSANTAGAPSRDKPSARPIGKSGPT